MSPTAKQVAEMTAYCARSPAHKAAFLGSINKDRGYCGRDAAVDISDVSEKEARLTLKFIAALRVDARRTSGERWDAHDRGEG